MAWMQLEGPHGPVYVRPSEIAALEGEYAYQVVPTAMGGVERTVRNLHLRGHSAILRILDTPDNVIKVLDVLNEEGTHAKT